MQTCFVIQGFGEKTDFATGRKLDLDASYEVIKEAVTAAGMKCVRADEIQHSGTIEVPMYEQIQRADLVIADLSTSNLNATYELGVRHGLRKKATIIVAEKEFSFPFDVNHIAIRTYEHLGSDLGRKEAKRFAQDLEDAIRAILASPKTDSPVYTFLPGLAEPAAGEEPTQLTNTAMAVESKQEQSSDVADQSAKMLMDQARNAIRNQDFGSAKPLLLALHAMRPHDDYITQQLALATYNSARDRDSLVEANGYLMKLNPDTANDPETLRLWGAFHKRLWNETGKRSDLETALQAYEKGFQLRNDYYNGTNFAFLLNVRATLAEPPDAIADFVLARRVRMKLLPMVEKLLGELEAEEQEVVPGSDEAHRMAEEKYWLHATLWESAYGLGDERLTRRWQERAEQAATAEWMLGATQIQLQKLEPLLQQSPLKFIADRPTSA